LLLAKTEKRKMSQVLNATKKSLDIKMNRCENYLPELKTELVDHILEKVHLFVLSDPVVFLPCCGNPLEGFPHCRFAGQCASSPAGHELNPGLIGQIFKVIAGPVTKGTADLEKGQKWYYYISVSTQIIMKIRVRFELENLKKQQFNLEIKQDLTDEYCVISIPNGMFHLT
jgi:hypothetical protein